jgi:glycosyltransferase involved in cell wall biosynthesis
MGVSNKVKIAADNIPLISIIIPAYNEAVGIENTVKEVDAELIRSGFAYEIIVVDDGSTDGTYAKLQFLSQHFSALKAIRLSRNFGKEAALLNGLKASIGNAVITMDSDLQHPPNRIAPMLEKWRQGYVVVHGIKRVRTCDSLIAKWRAAIFYGTINIFGGVDLRNSSDFILLDRIAKDVMINRLQEHKRFYRGLARWVGFEQTTVYFDVAERCDKSKSRFSLASLFNLAATALVSFTTAPLRIISILGLITLLVSIAIGCDALISWFMGNAVSGYATIILTLLLISSFIMISLGIIGEYVGKIYEEIKDRPVGLVESSFGFNVEEQVENYNVGRKFDKKQDSMAQ